MYLQIQVHTYVHFERDFKPRNEYLPVSLGHSTCNYYVHIRTSCRWKSYLTSQKGISFSLNSSNKFVYINYYRIDK